MRPIFTSSGWKDPSRIFESNGFIGTCIVTVELGAIIPPQKKNIKEPNAS